MELYPAEVLPSPNTTLSGFLPKSLVISHSGVSDPTWSRQDEAVLDPLSIYFLSKIQSMVERSVFWLYSRNASTHKIKFHPLFSQGNKSTTLASKRFVDCRKPES